MSNELKELYKEQLREMFYDDQPGIRFPDMGNLDDSTDGDQWSEQLESRTDAFLEELTAEFVRITEELVIRHEGNLIF